MGLSDALIRLGMLVLALLLIAALVWGGVSLSNASAGLHWPPRRWQEICSVNMRARYASWPLAAPLVHSVIPSSSRPCAAYRRCEGVRSMWWRLMRLAHLNWLVTIAFSLCPAPSCSTRQARHSRSI